MQQFHTGETNKEGNPLAHGVLLNFATEAPGTYQRALISALTDLKSRDRPFAPPYMVLDLAYPEHIDIQTPEGKYTSPIPPPEDLNVPDAACAKILVSASSLVDLSHIQNGGASVVRCNPVVPAYAWFQAANLLLTYQGSHGRLVPFPIHHPDIEEHIVYQMLRVTPEEYQAYHRILDYSCRENGPRKGFEVAAKFAYTILEKRGIPFDSLTSETVDDAVCHVHLFADASNYGILLLHAPREELSDLSTSHAIYY